MRWMLAVVFLASACGGQGGSTAPPAAKGFGVVSLGRDGKQDTPDDVRSWDP